MSGWGNFIVPDLLSQTLLAVERGMDNLGIDLGEKAEAEKGSGPQKQNKADEPAQTEQAAENPAKPAATNIETAKVLAKASPAAPPSNTQPVRTTTKETKPPSDGFFGAFGILDPAAAKQPPSFVPPKKATSTARNTSIKGKMSATALEGEGMPPNSSSNSLKSASSEHPSSPENTSKNASQDESAPAKDISLSSLLAPETPTPETYLVEQETLAGDKPASFPSLPMWSNETNPPKDNPEQTPESPSAAPPEKLKEESEHLQSSIPPPNPLVLQILSETKNASLPFLNFGPSETESDGLSPLKEPAQEKLITNSNQDVHSNDLSSLAESKPLVNYASTNQHERALKSHQKDLKEARNKSDYVEPETSPETNHPANEALVKKVVYQNDITTADATQLGGKLKEGLFSPTVEQLVTLHEKIANMSAQMDDLQDVVKQKDARIETLELTIASLKETNSSLVRKIENAEMAKSTIQNDMASMKKEFSDRLADYERKMTAAIREKDAIKKDNTSVEEYRKQLQIKEQEYQDIRREGDQLSKKICALETTIKKLRADLIESEQKGDSLNKNLQVSEAKQASLNEKIRELESSKSEMKAQISDREGVSAHYARQLSEKNKELEAANAKIKELSSTMNESARKIEDVQKLQTTTIEKADLAVRETEARVREELTREMKKIVTELESRESDLKQTVSDQRVTITRITEQAGWREESLRKEIQDLRERYTESERRYEEMVATVPNSTRPLLRQIENLQRIIDSHNESSRSIQQSLNDSLQQTLDELSTTKEREQAAQTKALDLTSKISVLETQIVALRSENSRLASEIQTWNIKTEESTATIERLRDEIALHRSQDNISARDLKLQIEKLQQDLVNEREQHEKTRLQLLQEKEDLSHQIRSESITPTTRTFSITQIQSPPPQRNQSVGDLLRPLPNILTNPTASPSIPRTGFGAASNDDILEGVLRGSKVSQAFTSRGLIGASTLPVPIMDEIDSYLKLKDGEIASLQQRMQSTENDRDILANELVSLTAKNEELLKENATIAAMKARMEEMTNMYNAVLEVLGEKVELVAELQADLMDVKSLYRDQIEYLINEVTRLQSQS